VDPQHFQALLMPGLIPNLLWHVAFLASVLISYPFLRQGQAEVEQRMLLTTDVAHEYTDLAVVDLAPVAAPLPFHPYRMRAPLGKATGIKGDDAIGFAQPIGHLPD